jgi:hypothetical protein
MAEFQAVQQQHEQSRQGARRLYTIIHASEMDSASFSDVPPTAHPRALSVTDLLDKVATSAATVSAPADLLGAQGGMPAISTWISAQQKGVGSEAAGKQDDGSSLTQEIPVRAPSREQLHTTASPTEGLNNSPSLVSVLRHQLMQGSAEEGDSEVESEGLGSMAAAPLSKRHVSSADIKVLSSGALVHMSTRSDCSVDCTFLHTVQTWEGQSAGVQAEMIPSELADSSEGSAGADATAQDSDTYDDDSDDPPFFYGSHLSVTEVCRPCCAYPDFGRAA